MKHSVVPAKSEPEPVQSFDSPRSPSETTNLFVSVAAKISLKWSRPRYLRWMVQS